MKLLVVCQYYHPEPFKIAEICEGLVARGHEVTVLTGLPNYPSGHVPEEYRRGRRRRERLGGVDVIRTWEIPRRPGALGLALNYASFMLSGSLRALWFRDSFDAIFVYQLSPISMALPAVILRRRSHRPLLLYALDLWPESIKTLLKSETSLAFRATRSFSRYIYRAADAICVTSRSFSDYLADVHGIESERISYLPQHAADASVEAERPDATVDFFFIGNMGIAQDIGCIIEAVERMRDVPGFMLHFVGDGSYSQAARDLVEEKRLGDRVVFHGRHPRESMPDFFRQADVCLLTLKADNLTGRTIPGKLQEYMAAGKPVIAAIEGEAADVIRAAGCGECVAASDSAALASAMTEMVGNWKRIAVCGANARRYHEENFTLDHFLDAIESQLDALPTTRPGDADVS